MTSQIDRFITIPQFVDAIGDPVPFHEASTRDKDELGEGSRRYMSASLIPEADMGMGIRKINQVPPNFKRTLEPHKHEVSEIYAVIGDLTVEFFLEGETREVTGPAAIFIPPGMMHTYRPVKGSGYFVVVSRGGKYKASAAT